MADFNGPPDTFDEGAQTSLNETGVGAVNSADMEAEPATLFSAAFTSEDSISAGTFAHPSTFGIAPGSHVAESSIGAADFSGEGSSVFDQIRFKKIDHRAAGIDRIVWQLRQGYNPLTLELLPTRAQTGEDSLSAGVFA